MKRIMIKCLVKKIMNFISMIMFVQFVTMVVKSYGMLSLWLHLINGFLLLDEFKGSVSLRIILLNNPFFGRLIYFVDFNFNLHLIQLWRKVLEILSCKHRFWGWGLLLWDSWLYWCSSQGTDFFAFILCVYSLYLLVLLWNLVIFSFNQYLVLCRQCQYFCVEIASISNINALFVANWDFLINLLMQSQQRYILFW